MYILKSKSIGRDTISPDEDGLASAIPNGAAVCQQILITTDTDAYVGFGNSATVPAASESNTTYHDAGTLVYTMRGDPAREGYVYVYAVSTTVVTVTKLSFYG
jgi:hypothetical protein